jgi:secernin
VKTWLCECRVRRNLTEGKVAHAKDVRDLFAILRDHGEGRGSPHYRLATGAMGAPCMHAGGALASSQTVASWASELTSGGASHWATATAAPCTSLFKPIRIAEPVDLGAPIDREDSSLWWRHERLHRAAMRDPARFRRLIAEERDDLERAWVSAPPSSREAFAQADECLARWIHAVAGELDRRPPWVRRYWRLRDRRAGLSRN